jgi:flagellin-like protein
MMRERGLSPIVATVLLIAITAMAAVPIAWYLAGYYAPFRPKYVDLAVYAGLIDENTVRFHIQHIGGETINFEEGKPTTDEIRAWAKDPVTEVENEVYCWTFENPSKFRQSDWAYCEVQIPDAEFAVWGTIEIRVVHIGGGGLLCQREVTINSMDQIPGG